MSYVTTSRHQSSHTSSITTPSCVMHVQHMALALKSGLRALCSLHLDTQGANFHNFLQKYTFQSFPNTNCNSYDNTFLQQLLTVIEAFLKHQALCHALFYCEMTICFGNTSVISTKLQSPLNSSFGLWVFKTLITPCKAFLVLTFTCV